MSTTRLAVIALAVVALHGSADASPIFYSSVFAGVTTFPSGESVSDSQLVFSTDTLGPEKASLADGSAWASVTDGALRAYATTGGNSAANGTAGFFDTLLLQSASLAPGTAVQLAVELLFTRTLSENGAPGPCSSKALATASIDGSNSHGNAGQVLVTDATCNNQDVNNPTALFTGFIGEELTLAASLAASVAPFSGSATADASADYSVDASHALRFLVTPVGDFTYTTASGNSYLAAAAPDPAAVPEPATLLLFGSALSIAAARARKRSRAHEAKSSGARGGCWAPTSRRRLVPARSRPYFTFRATRAR
ncbi:MAG: PEP-CTERM sorting domain-containing protein [Acidobacteria bacterium]|nr:PEP-CTERM sorting domain-containing protein [Acidobacteriota bacterium]